jgi:hypothetical protein
MQSIVKSLVASLIEAEELAYPRGNKIRDAFWPILNNDQKREYMYRKENFVIIGDVDRMLEAFSGDIEIPKVKVKTGWK